jgi:hypothetical protein
MTQLILKRAPLGDNQDDYDVLENGVGRPQLPGRRLRRRIAAGDLGERP